FNSDEIPYISNNYSYNISTNLNQIKSDLAKTEQLIAENTAEFKVKLILDNVESKCYGETSSPISQCMITNVTGKIINEGIRPIRGVKFEYLLNDVTGKDINGIGFPQLYSPDSEIGENQSVSYKSGAYFGKENIPPGAYTLKITVIEILTEKAIATAEIFIKLQE
ncbi:MAG: hypothetical protein HY544_03665, partial [Candidatus Diapherotrites archaeon]|nr:hypothetical protein [Candidatus Diapherotrites archaeon]